MRLRSTSRPLAICRSRTSQSAARRASASIAVSVLLVSTDTTRRNGQSSSSRRSSDKSVRSVAVRCERQAGFERVRDAELGEHFADARRGVGERAEGDDDVAGASMIRSQPPLDVPGDLDDFVVRAGGFDDFQLLKRCGGGR